MSFTRSIVGALSAAVILAVLPAAAHAQTARRTACNDGSTTSSAGASACDGHGGINKARTTVLNRAPNKPAATASVQQAGKPAQAHPRYEERRGWRWQRHHDEHKREEKHERVKCRDGKWVSAEGKGKDVCKHHRGVAH